MKLLGEYSDAVVAKKIGRTLSAVVQKRLQCGRPAIREKDRTGGHEWTPGDLEMLGHYCDRYVAQHQGRSENAVRQRRFLEGWAPVSPKNCPGMST